jgi:acyl-CoA synthetase (AMP-forming)/AMP-acid ligase II
MSGYWNNSPATLEAMRGGVYHTGDMGYLDECGYLFLVDRKKDMIISGGENIYSREVEDALAQHPDVALAAVIGAADTYWGEQVKGIVVLREGAATTAAALIAHCRDTIAHYKSPKSIEFVGEMPLLANGKIDKLALRARFGAKATVG